MNLKLTMKRSNHSNIISTTQLLPHFSLENLSVMKLCIFEQLACSNESQFICKALHSLHNTMSNESSAIIRNKAIEIADSQSMTQSSIQQQQTKNNNKKNDTNPIATNDYHITVYKYIVQQYNDRLSKLPSDVIDYFGSFLTKKESIKFGYLNKQLFIETKKYSYLLKRCNDPTLYINDFVVARSMYTQGSLFHHYFSNDLYLEHYQEEYASKLSCFNNVFGRVNSITCRSLQSLCYIPCHVLFDIYHNYFPLNSEQRSEIEKVSIHGTVKCSGDKVPETIKIFCENFNKYKNSVNDNNNGGNNKHNVRCIKQLVLDLYACDWHKAKAATKKLLSTLAPICKSIEITSGRVMILTMQELENVFHKNLKRFCSFGELIIAPKDCIKKESNIGNLEVIACKLSKVFFLNHFDRFNMRRLIKHYEFDWERASSSMNIFDVFDRVLFQDYDKHPKLERITIKFCDDTKLSSFAKLLVCLNQHYDKLFKQLKQHLTHFKSIELEFGWWLVDLQTHTPQGDTDDELIYNFESNQEYPRNEKAINIENIQQGIESFGIIYKNVFKWLKSRQQDGLSLRTSVRIVT